MRGARRVGGSEAEHAVQPEGEQRGQMQPGGRQDVAERVRSLVAV